MAEAVVDILIRNQGLVILVSAFITALAISYPSLLSYFRPKTSLFQTGLRARADPGAIGYQSAGATPTPIGRYFGFFFGGRGGG